MRPHSKKALIYPIQTVLNRQRKTNGPIGEILNTYLNTWETKIIFLDDHGIMSFSFFFGFVKSLIFLFKVLFFPRDIY